MKTSSADLFKKSLDKAYSQPGITLNQNTMMDNMKYKQSFKEEKLEGGLSDKKTLNDIAKKHEKNGVHDILNSLKKQFAMGIRVEMEHTKDKAVAKEIVMDHLWEDPKYYSKIKKIENMSETKEDENTSKHNDLVKHIHNKMTRTKGKEYAPDVHELQKWIDQYYSEKVEKKENNEATGTGSSGAFEGPLFSGEDKFMTKSDSETPKLKEGVDGDVEKLEATEATTSGSVGGYESPSMWAKSTKKKDWGPSRKTQLPGGSFVKVKKKCTKFPYCNQGDINALKISKNESVKEAIKNISQKFKISESVIINILEHEFSKIKKVKK